MEQPPFALKPSPLVMIAVVAIILALVVAGAWRNAPPLVLGALALAALGLALIALALRRRA